MKNVRKKQNELKVGIEEVSGEMGQQLHVNVSNEYDNLQSVVVVPPKYMKITDVINTTQRHYFTENINSEIALKQHEQFTHALTSENIDVIHLEPVKDLNEQVFTRDIGFAIGNNFFVANLKKAIRKQEELVLEDWLHKNNIPYHSIPVESVEGGDVLVDNGKIWIGLSNRTSLQAIHYLQNQLPTFEVNTVTIHKEILHLDCTLNFISEDIALVFKPGVDDESYLKLKKHFQLIEVTEDEQFHLGPNMLAIGNKKIITLPSNKRLNKILESLGYDMIEVDFSEIIKSGGSFRCCTLPLLRS